MTKQEFATLVVAMQAMYGEDFIGTEQALDVWYALLHDLDYQILSKALQQYMLTNKFKPTVAELREIYAELVSPVISAWSEGWEKVSKAIGYYGMYQEEAASVVCKDWGECQWKSGRISSGTVTKWGVDDVDR